MNFGVWGVQVFITYFFISYIYYVLYIKRVYENHMIMCDGYMMLTFFISMRLVNRNNCLASKQASKQASIENCAFVKTILMVLVVLYHSCLFWSGSWLQNQQVKIEAKEIGIFAYWLNSFHIYGFTLVSGYLFYYLKNEVGKYKKYKEFLIRKFQRLIIPYYFTAIVWVIPFSILILSYSGDEVIQKFGLGINPSQLWFLWMLFGVFAIAWPMSQWIKTDYIALIISVISWGIGLIGPRFGSNIFCIWNVFTYLPYFVLGMKMREKEHIWKKYNCFVLAMLNIGLFLLWRYLLGNGGIFFKILTLISEYAMHVIGAVAVFMILQWIADKVDWKNKKLCNLLSKYSMPIYLFHQQIIYITIVWLNGKVNPYLNVTINFIVALSGSIIISGILMRFRVTNFLLGQK